MSSGTISFQETRKSNKTTHLECDKQRINHLAQKKQCTRGQSKLTLSLPSAA